MNLENKIKEIETNFVRVYQISHCTAKISPPSSFKAGWLSPVPNFKLNYEIIWGEVGVVVGTHFCEAKDSIAWSDSILFIMRLKCTQTFSHSTNHSCIRQSIL